MQNLKLSSMFLVFLASFTLLFLFSGITYAKEPLGIFCDESNDGANGMVPCGRGTDPEGNLLCRCSLIHIFVLIKNIFSFLAIYIAAPLAGLFIVFGGILIMISGGPGAKGPIGAIAKTSFYDTGKRMIVYSIVGAFLIWGSWLIIDIVLKAIGYTGNWSSPPL